MIVKDKDFKLFISESELQEIVARVGTQISRDYADKQPIVCPVLTGSFLFAADVVRHIEQQCMVQFVKYSSYCGTQTTGKVVCHLPFTEAVCNQDVLIIEDIIDTGISMEFLLNELRSFKPRSIRICTLFFKPESFRKDYKVDYIGREIGNEFIVGYGLDYDGYGRTLKDIWVINE